jgi:hypothetical protein
MTQEKGTWWKKSLTHLLTAVIGFVIGRYLFPRSEPSVTPNTGIKDRLLNSERRVGDDYTQAVLLINCGSERGI